ncbi:hypothetical protein F3I02_17460 [Bacillus sp. SRB3LM]|nr:hypothetical protein [Bacillus sp. SRB3LM]MBG0969113.1 hypothetical protein [Bacillus sp. SRB3LM]MBG0970356.1 hypothetical protein [Bacillus sp. SRB3LM]MBG0970671.1 hypothetical protein [Bacillus sp. SRB3LM]
MTKEFDSKKWIVLRFSLLFTTFRRDLRLKDFTILSDKTIYKNLKFFQSLGEKLTKTQRIFPREKNGSFRWNKQRVKVAKMYKYKASARKD